MAGLPLQGTGVGERRRRSQGRPGPGQILGVPRPALRRQSSGFSDENLAALARKAGLDTKQFESDYENARYERLVRADFQKGLDLGVNGTPTFFINGETLVGLQPVGVFEDAIEDARREAEGG